jgi:hypothetical protein
VERAIDREGKAGWLYDARVLPARDARPQVRDTDAPLETFALDVASGDARPASAQQAAALARHDAAAAGTQADGPAGWRARVAPVRDAPLGTLELVASDPQGRDVACEATACRGRVAALWWQEGAQALLFQRREGWNNETAALYRWRPGDAAPERVLATSDALIGCAPARAMLLCLRENARTPRRLVSIDPATGRSATLFDPNPEFAKMVLGEVRRLKWRNEAGLEAWGDLVLPPKRASGGRLPLIVVQYHSRGFLRGGTNDEYPIHLFAARGFAVLSLERPAAIGSLDPGARTGEAMIAANQRGWAERRSLFSSLMTGVDAAIATGLIDPLRIGLTGLSDGATTTRFALINSSRFAAAAISTCCADGRTAMTYGGMALADFNLRIGLPPTIAPDTGFWAPVSFAASPERLGTPLLMQLADSEYLLALESFQALREAGRAVEMYVFPDEYHGKWQPSHRLAIFERDIDWFAFWLRGETSADPARQAQYARWRAMRDKQSASGS